MDFRNSHHLRWTVVALATFALGYLAGHSPDVRRSSHTDDPVTNAAAEQSRAEGLGGPGGKSTADMLREPGESASNSQAGSTGIEKALPTLVERAAQAMLTGSDLRRQRTFLAVLEEMQPQDALAVRSMLAKATGQGVIYENLWEQFWTRWGEIDGPAAMDFILKAPYGVLDKDLTRVMRGWGATHPEEAAQWLEANQQKEGLASALIGLTDGYAGENLSGATSLALTAAPAGDPLRARLMETLAEQAVRQGRLHGLTQWFESLPSEGNPGSARAAALGHVYWRLWRADQDRALEWVQEQSSRPWRSDRLIGEAAQRVAGTDPSKALTWLQTVSPSPQDGSFPGIESVVRAWITVDADTATRALDSLAPGPFRDQALAARQRLGAARATPR